MRVVSRRGPHSQGGPGLLKGVAALPWVDWFGCRRDGVDWFGCRRDARQRGDHPSAPVREPRRVSHVFTQTSPENRSRSPLLDCSLQAHLLTCSPNLG